MSFHFPQDIKAWMTGAVFFLFFVRTTWLILSALWSDYNFVPIDY